MFYRNPCFNVYHGEPYLITYVNTMDLDPSANIAVCSKHPIQNLQLVSLITVHICNVVFLAHLSSAQDELL